MSNELKPCPFCACVMQIESNRYWHKIIGDHGGWCLWNEDTDFSWPATDVGMRNLLKTWNTRAEPDVRERANTLLDEQMEETMKDMNK